MKDEFCQGCPFYNNTYVPQEGPTSPRIVAIGEAPGENEEKERRPFVGGAGKIFNSFLRRVGIDRKDIYITNVLKCRPPKNNLRTREAQRAIGHCMPRLQRELAKLHPVVTVPMGNYALRSIGYQDRIGKMRGSITTSSKYGKIIPTWHPAAIMRDWGEYQTSVHDWRKIKRHAENVGYKLPSEYFSLAPSIEDVELFTLQLEQRAEKEMVSVAIDLETPIFDSQLAIPIKLFGISVSDTTAMCIPFVTQSGNLYWQTHDKFIRAIMCIGRILENTRIEKMFFNALFDVTVLMNHGFNVVGPIYDIMVAHWLVYHPTKHDLGHVASLYTDYPAWKLMKGSTDKEEREYNCRDCVVLHMIRPGIAEDLRDTGTTHVFGNMMNNVLPTVRMMLNGIRVDEERRAKVEKQLEGDVKRLESELSDLAGVPGLNPNSPPQLREVLFERMRLRSQVKTKGKKDLSTSEEVLKRLSIRHPDNKFVDRLLDYRNLHKLYSVYSRPPVLGDGRVHSHFGMTTLTGRFKSANPNVQNLPSGKRGDKGESQKYIRRMYTPPPGFIYVASDLSQAEVMVYAILANDEPWLACFAEGEDIHRQNMLDMLGHYEEKYRTFIKNFVFGLIYGSEGQEIQKVMPKELQAQGITVTGMLHRLWATHPALESFRKAQETSILKRRRVVNPFGRVRYFVGKVSKANIREGVNFPIQSTVGDVMHIKMAQMDEELPEYARIVLQLHDEIIVECPLGRWEDIAQQMQGIMERKVIAPSGHEFAFKVEIEKGPSLLELEKVA